jgi:hypothetical protein
MSKKSLWADDSRCLHSHPTTCHASHHTPALVELGGVHGARRKKA